jgi:hypothetical protein
MKVDNIDTFEIVVRPTGLRDFLCMLDWIEANGVDCSRVKEDIWIVSGEADATLMKLWWG